MLPPIETVLEQIVRDLKTPAGGSGEFSTPDNILNNRKAFVERCHETWKRLHIESIKRLFFFEGWLQREKTNPIGNAAVEYAEYHRAVIRRVNDSIIWSVFGLQRHVIKRFCLYRKRPALLESNPDSVYASVQALNAHPMSLAIWNDATSCVDIGDLTFVKNGLLPIPEFIELKSGNVNAEILELLSLKGEEHSKKFEEFRTKRSKSGVKQYERVVRQQKTGEQALDLLANERGIDPVSGLETSIVDIPVEQETYDDDLDRVLVKALASQSEEIELIAGCMWLYANADPKVNCQQAALRFVDFLYTEISEGPRSGLRRPSPQDRDRIVQLGWGLHYPVSIPIFLRNLDSSAIAATLCGELRSKVMLYIDWDRFAKLCNDSGATFSLVGGKAVRRARSTQSDVRPPLVSGRLAQVKVEDVRMPVTDPSLVRMLFDGTTPQTIIKNMIAHAGIIMMREGEGVESSRT